MMSVLSAGWPFRVGESFGRVRVGGLGAGAAATRARTVHALAVARCRLKFPVPECTVSTQKCTLHTARATLTHQHAPSGTHVMHSDTILSHKCLSETRDSSQ